MKISLKNQTFLIVDDEAGICNSLAMYLNLLGAKTYVAGGGEEAIKIVASQKIDMVISDVRMPKGDGIKLLEDIRRNNPQLPAVLLATGFADLTEAEAKKRGALALIMKPIDYDQLHTIIAKTLSLENS